MAVRRKTAPEDPDLTDDLDPAPPTLRSGDQWETVRADDTVVVDPEVADADLRECIWTGADLAGRRLSGFHARDVRFERCDLSGAHLDGAGLTRVVFDGCRLTGASLSGATLRDVVLRECRADLLGLRLAKADYLLAEDCSLREADLYGARLTQTALLRCDLAGADFEGARLEAVDLHGSSLADIKAAASLRGAAVSPDQVHVVGPLLLAAAGIRVTERQP